MRVPTRRGEKLNPREPVDLHLTPQAVERMKRELERLIKVDRPTIIEDVQRTAQMGDFSENFGYQHAKAQLRRTNDRILTLEARIAHAIVIDKSKNDGIVRIGSAVTIANEEKVQTFEILGSLESNPFKGRISYKSPLGDALMGRRVGDHVEVEVAGRVTDYQITEIA